MEKIILNGKNLDLPTLRRIAYDGEKIELDPEAVERAKAARQVLFDMAAEGKPVYGLNRGVGWNKDKEFDADYFEQYNRNMLNCHSLGVAPYCTIEEVRAMMVIRLNTALCGSCGIGTEIIGLYKEFLNRGIHPRVHKRGSIGEGDITTLSLIGLAFMGEADVEYKGEIINAGEAMKRENLIPPKLGPKDGLSIVSSNAQGAAFAAIAVMELEEYLNVSNLIYCLAWEGLNGVIDPINADVNDTRELEGQIEMARRCRKHLVGSYLHTPHPTRHLQDPLSFRGGFSINGSVLDSMNYVKKLLHIQMNTTDDNPCILLKDGKTYVSCNFEVTSLSVGMEMIALALGHLSRVIAYRMIRITDPAFTHLTRFLSPDEEKVIAYSTIQKTFSAIDAENRHLLNPNSMDCYSIAGNIEDHASFLPFTAEKVSKMVDNLRYMSAIELIHAMQAIDIRRMKEGEFALGVDTKKVYEVSRKEVPFYDKDRNISIDIANAYNIVKNGVLNEFVE